MNECRSDGENDTRKYKIIQTTHKQGIPKIIKTTLGDKLNRVL